MTSQIDIRSAAEDTAKARFEIGEPAGRRWLFAALRSGWVPAALLTALTALALRFYGVPLATTGAFLTYIAAGICLPGTLVWRVVHRRSGWFVSDVAAGTATGYAIEVLTYIPARAIGAPLLVLLSPVVTIGVFLAVPGLRRYWRGSDNPDDRTPTWWAWSLAGVVAVVVLWSCTRFFRVHGLNWPYMGSPDGDSPFHLALIGEAKHHMPLITPWLSDEPVLYHWFVYAEMAATSWVTGIEPQVLLLRLSLLPMLATFAALIAVIARRLTRVWWTGPIAAVGTFFVLAPNPYPWPLHGLFTGYATSPYDDGSSFRLVLWTSPTQTFGVMLFAALVLVLIGLLQGTDGRVAHWILLVVLMTAVMGGKATFLPILFAALLLVVAVHLVVSRRVHCPALVAAVLTAIWLLFAQFVLFGGASQGLELDPLHQMRISGATYTTNFTTSAQTPMWRLLLMAAVTVLCWAYVWAGIGGLAARRRWLVDPAVVLLLGIGAAGMGGILLLGHQGQAEGWFLASARPYLTLAAVVGVVAVTRTREMTWRVGAALLGATLTGALVVHIVRLVGDPAVPTAATVGGYKRLAFALTWPYLVLVGAATLFGLALVALRRRFTALHGLTFALLVSMLAGMGLLATYNHVADSLRTSSAQGWRNVAPPPYISEGTMEASRWLRDHSHPDDLVATNAHCVLHPGWPADFCDNRHFFFAAYAERRFLIEGWGFTNSTHAHAKATKSDIIFVGYWDPARLAANDAAFRTPSAETVRRLRDEYRVRWLLVDERQDGPGADLDKYATLRYRAGKLAVYEIDR